jgi:DNA-binding NtrC family response regulator
MQRTISQSIGVPSAWRGTGTLLVIDDDVAVLQVSRLILERFGFTVHTAPTGRAGAEYFQAHAGEVRCVLLDMTMPDWNGDETFRRLAAIDPLVRVILTSGYSESQALEEFGQSGLAGFLQKPYQLTSLVDAVRQALGE